MSKRRIMIIGPLPPAVGGQATFITSVLKSNLNRKYTFITFRTDRPTAGVNRTINDYSLMFRIGFGCMVKSIIVTISHMLIFPLYLIFDHPYLVHINTSSHWSFWENTIYNILSKMFLKKTLIHIHAGTFFLFYNESNKIGKYLIRKSLGFADGIIVLSSLWRSYLLKLPINKYIFELKNFVDITKYEKYKQEQNAFNSPIRVLFIGGIAAKIKGVYVILKAIPIVIEKIKANFCFVACNDVEDLFDICDKENILPYIKTLEYIHDETEKIKVYFSSDIYILPSYMEGLPLTILEAMAAGLPIIATSVGAIPEVIENDINGFIIKPGDHQALAEKIIILGNDTKRRQIMSINNKEKILKKYNITVVMRKLDNIYELIMK